MASWNLSNSERKCEKNEKPEVNGKSQKNSEDIKDCEKQNTKL